MKTFGSKVNNLISKSIETGFLDGNDVYENRYIPQMINLDAIMALEKIERDVILSFINERTIVGEEVRNMLITKGIITNITE